MTELVSGFVQSREFLNKTGVSLEMCSDFPDVERVWKMEIKSEKMLKSFEFFSKLQQDSAL